MPPGRRGAKTSARTRGRAALSIRIELGAARLGPGKIELLTHLAREQSLAAAARAMQMSYRRAWELLAQLNAMFRTPVATTLPGRNRAGATTLSATGQRVIALYRQVEQDAQRVSAPGLRELQKLQAAAPRGREVRGPIARRATRRSRSLADGKATDALPRAAGTGWPAKKKRPSAKRARA